VHSNPDPHTASLAHPPTRWYIRSIMNLNDKINRSRPGHPPPPDPARHARRCAVRHHPERDATRSSGTLPEHTVKEREDLESPQLAVVAGNAGPLVTRHLSLVTDFLIETPQRLEIVVTQTKQSIEPHSNRDKITPPSKPIRMRKNTCDATMTRPSSDAGSAGPLACPEAGNPDERVTRHSPLDRDFLTGTRKQLETPVTITKQTTEVLSNRDTNTTIAKAD
jgi:hypothetical protein